MKRDFAGLGILGICIAAFAAVVTLAAAPAAYAASGSGRLATEQRAVSGFDAIAVSGSIDLVVRPSGREAVEVTADDNLVPLIETYVDGHTLKIRFKRGENIWHTHRETHVTVDVAQLTEVSSSGSGDVKIGALKTPKLAISLSGSGDLAFSDLSTERLEVSVAGSSDVSGGGSARSLKLSIAGSGDAKLSELQAEDVDIRISGSGDARVNAQRTLSVSIAGSGDVRYRGNPQVRSSVAGSGSISKEGGSAAAPRQGTSAAEARGSERGSAGPMAQARAELARARRELATGNIPLDGGLHIGRHHGRDHDDDHDRDDLPRAEITPQGDLLIAGKAQEVTAEQRALLKAYRAGLVGVASAGVDIGEQAVGVAAHAVWEALWAVFTGADDDEIEAAVEARTGPLKDAARALCTRLPELKAQEERLAAALPAFRPYARMDERDIDDCEV